MKMVMIDNDNDGDNDDNADKCDDDVDQPPTPNYLGEDLRWGYLRDINDEWNCRLPCV